MTCSKVALALSVLGTVGVGVIISMSVVSLYGAAFSSETSGGGYSGGPPGSAFWSASRCRRSSADSRLTTSRSA